ncbi:hypothetical protein [Geodermatophilus amargosae]|uniref:hypothetical protein n=1 Tax=Geodermatophilus amargosae TaxID=1296565 RepID=UPI001114ACF1|nr:hypothetical protein [Geodermatophilus amargosae]
MSLVSSLLVLPILSARFGQDGWSSVLLGQSIGAAASVVCALAWPMEGPDLASRAGAADRVQMYATSLRERTVAVAAAVPVLVVMCLFAGPTMPLVCILSALAFALNALAPTWYFIGVSRPSRSLVAEGVPRLVVNLVAIGLVALLPLWTYPVALIVGMLCTLLIASTFVRRDARNSAGAVDLAGSPRGPAGGRRRLLTVTARGADAGYSYLSGPLIALLVPAAYPLYAAVDRLGQSMVNLMGTITQGLMAWIGEGGVVKRGRLVGAVVLASAFAFGALLVLSLATPFLLGYLFAGTVEVNALIAVLAGVIVGGAFLSRCLSVVLLIPQGLAVVTYRLLLVASCIGLPSVAVAAVVGGSVGALAVAAAVPWAVVAAQLVMGLHRRPQGRVNDTALQV